MPTIEFTAYNEKTLKTSKPVLASTVQPEWWKKMKINEIVRGDKQQTIRACPAMQDWLTMGYYLVAEEDVFVQIESKLGISIPEEETFDIMTVSALCEVVERHVQPN